MFEKPKESEVLMLNGVVKSKEGIPVRRQIFAACGTVMLTVSSGATSGYSAVLLPQLQEDGGFYVDITIISWIAAISCLPLFAGNLISGFLMERFGRRGSQLMLAIPFAAGWAVIAFASNIHFILLGRFLTGFCQGWLGPAGPVFVGEISTPKYRGFLLASLSLSIAIGVFASHLYGTYLHWKLSAILCALFPSLGYIILLFVPESPSWLASKGQLEECKTSFEWYRGCGEDAKTELTKMIAQYAKSTTNQSFLQKLKTNIRKPEFRKPLQVMTTFFVITQLTGTNVICAYTAAIVKPIIGDGVSEYTIMLVLDILRCISLAGSCILMRRIDRRPLAMFSGGFTALSLILLALYIYLVKVAIISKSSALITVGLIIAYIIISSIGIVPLPWTMVGETFPAATRGLGSGISVMMTSIAFFATVKTAPALFADIGLDGTFLFYGMSTLAGTIFLYFNLPETRGKTLLQVEEYFTRGKRSFSKNCESTDA